MGTRRNIVFLLAMVTLATAEIFDKGWWKHTVFYQIYPRSFKDSDGNGIGDLKGITEKLEHFKKSGIGAIWLSPINKSPMHDFGYDISDFRDVDPTFGTLADLDDLIKKAKSLKLKVILDLVPNHTSDEHVWFQMSVNRTKGYEDYYIWSDGKKVTNPNGTTTTVPINNWVSVFNGSAWTWNEKRKQFYFRQFLPQQPDLNYNNPTVRREMEEIMKFWLDKGMDGFRIDAVPHLFENNQTQDEPASGVPGAKPTEHIYYNHILTKDQPQTYELIKSWREFVDKYADERNQSEKVLMTEAYTSWENTLKYYSYGAHIPFNFKFITDANGNSNATTIKSIINRWIQQVPMGASVPNWVMGNHDRSRLATRYPGRADQMIMLAMVLPGVAVTYYGEEIGMEDGDVIISDFRDGCRTPFQWDDSKNAGFSNGNKTWLPVHKNYQTLNLKNEQGPKESHYKLYTGLTNLRNSPALKYGDIRTEILKQDVLTVIRSTDEDTITLLINFSNEKDIPVNLTSLVNGKSTKIKLSSVDSKLLTDTPVTISNFVVPAKVSVILHTTNSATSIGTISYALLLVACIFTFKS